MKKGISLILSLLMIVLNLPVLAVEDTENTNGDWKYSEYTFDNGTVTESDDIKGIAITAYLGDKEDIYIPEKISGQNVIAIANDAFMGNTSLNSVCFPESILVVEEGAFKDCENLICVLFNKSLVKIGKDVFSGCGLLNSIIVYSNVEVLPKYMFRDCPNAVMYCEKNSYAHNYAILGGVNFSLIDDESSISGSCDEYSYVVNNGTAKIVECNLWEVPDGILEIPATIDGYIVTEIGQNAFMNMQTEITEFIIPDTVKKIERDAFRLRGISRASINLPKNIEYIGDYVLSYVSVSFTDNCVFLPKSLTYIGEHNFNLRSEQIIRCYKDSYAQTYAEKNGHNYMLVESEDDMHYTTTVNNMNFAVGNSYAILLSIDSISNGHIEIPSEVDGVPVKMIGRAVCSKLTSSDVTSVTIPDTVEIICGRAFANCSFTEVTIPDSVKVIGSYAFDGNKNLKKVTLSKNLKAVSEYMFRECSMLEEISIPDSVESIGQYAFQNCALIKTVQIPEKVESLETRTFSGCSSLKTVIFNNNIKSLGSSTFSGCSSLELTTLPESLTYIGDYCFASCNSITEITIPGSVNSFGFYVFSRCQNIEKIILSEGITNISYMLSEIGSLDYLYLPESFVYDNSNQILADSFWVVKKDSHLLDELPDPSKLYIIEDGDEPSAITRGAFGKINYMLIDGEMIITSYDSSENEDVVLPSEINGYPVKKIWDNAFYGKSIKSITVPEGVEMIGGNAFSNCKSLTSVNLPTTLVNLGTGAFANCTSLTQISLPNNIKKLKGTFSSCTALKSVKLPENLEVLEGTFPYCKALTSITFPDSLKVIGQQTFRISGLTSIELPEGLTHLGSEAFAYSKELVSAKLPDSLQDLSNAFTGCTSLRDINIPKNVTRLSSNTFHSCESLSLLSIHSGVTEFSSISFYGIPNLVILCEENSPAQKFAMENGFCYSTDEETVAIFGQYEKFKYTQLNGQVYITDYVENTNSVTIGPTSIPSRINGYPVKGIMSLAFHGVTFSSKVNIPENVEVIGYLAFGYIGLSSGLTLPSTLKYIGDTAFGYTKIPSVTIPENVIKVGPSAFCDANIGTVEFSNPDTKLENGVFSSCGYLGKVILPDNLTEIPENTFFVSNVWSVELPENLKSIGNNAFSTCRDYNINEIPEGVEYIGKEAFRNSEFTNLHIPRSVTKIEDTAFTNSKKLVINCYSDSEAHNFAVRNNIPYQLLDVREVKYTETLEGTVRYLDDSMAAGTEVQLLDEEGSIIAKTTSDSEGRYVFDNLEIGKYIVKAIDSNGNTDSEIIKIKRKNVFDLIISGEKNLVIKKSWKISGSLSTDKAEINLSNSEGDIVANITTNDGLFSFDNVMNGTYTINVKSVQGSATQTVVVFNDDVLNVEIQLKEANATITGKIVDEKNKQVTGATVTLYNSEGIMLDRYTTDKNGEYMFQSLTLGEYYIEAEFNTTKKNPQKGYDQPIVIKGFGYINIEISGSHKAENIKIYDISATPNGSDKNRYAIKGKITGLGTNNQAEVTLADISGNEYARLTTEKNGDYKFINVKDGIYVIRAINEDDGMGLAIVCVNNGYTFGETHIKIQKVDKIKIHEDRMKNDIPNVNTHAEAMENQDMILEEKEFYDKLPETEKKQLSKAYTDKLYKLIKLINETECVINGDETDKETIIANEGVLSDNENIKNADELKIEITIEKREECQIGEDGIVTDDEYIQQMIENTAGDKTLTQYYDISLKKGVKKNDEYMFKNVDNIAKDAESSGKLRFTITIPPKYRGHKNYYFVHVHNGEVTTIIDLDNNPDTITFEIDKFSTFALAYSDIELQEVIPYEYPANVTYDEKTQKITVSTSEDAMVYIATFNGINLKSVSSYPITAGQTESYDFNEENVVYVWNSNLTPLCEKFYLE